jgi:two-component system response regulator PilR (NtrC family)
MKVRGGIMPNREQPVVSPVTQWQTVVLLASSAGEERGALIRVLMQCGLVPILSPSVQVALATLGSQEVGLIVCADQLEDGSFRDLLRVVRKMNCQKPVIVASRLGECEEYLEAMRLGAFDLIAAPYFLKDVKPIVERALQEHPQSTLADESESTAGECREVLHGT